MSSTYWLLSVFATPKLELTLKGGRWVGLTSLFELSKVGSSSLDDSVILDHERTFFESFVLSVETVRFTDASKLVQQCLWLLANHFHALVVQHSNHLEPDVQFLLLCGIRVDSDPARALWVRVDLFIFLLLLLRRLSALCDWSHV